MAPFVEHTHKDSSSELTRGVNDLGFDPDKLIEPKAGDQFVEPVQSAFNPDKLIEPNPHNTSKSETSQPELPHAGDVERPKLYTSREERIDQTPKNHGEWTGDRGDSKFLHEDAEVRKALAEYGVDGIEYKDGVVDFSPISAQDVDIDMTSQRYGRGGNFEKADSKAAEEWNAQGRDGKTDWTSRDIKNWREENGYTWHECSDQRTCQLVPRNIHDNCRHTGGVLECKKREGVGNGGGFDD